MSSAVDDAGARPIDVLVLGASFAGVELVYQLYRREAGRKLRIVVIDRQREHGYVPLAHERLCRRTPDRQFVLPTARYIDSLPNAELVQDEVVALDPESKTVELASGTKLRGRFVVVALGSVSSPPAELAGREHLQAHKLADELAEAGRRLDEVLRGHGDVPRVLVVGGSITGVELAAELAHLRHATPAGWRAPDVTLVEDGARLIPGLADRAARKALRALKDQGVDVRLRTRLDALAATSAKLVDADGSAHELPFALAFWAGGVCPAPVLASLELPRTDDGWLRVGPTLQCFPTPSPTNPDVFACGDAVTIVGGNGEWSTMRRAIEALWQAKLVARNLLTLAAEPLGYPDGVPPLRPHVPRTDFPYGVSLGARSLIVYGRTVLDVPGTNIWFRRFLMREYLKRYQGHAPAPAVASGTRAG